MTEAEGLVFGVGNKPEFISTPDTYVGAHQLLVGNEPGWSGLWHMLLLSNTSILVKVKLAWARNPMSRAAFGLSPQQPDIPIKHMVDSPCNLFHSVHELRSEVASFFVGKFELPIFLYIISADSRMASSSLIILQTCTSVLF